MVGEGHVSLELQVLPELQVSQGLGFISARDTSADVEVSVWKEFEGSSEAANLVSTFS